MHHCVSYWHSNQVLWMLWVKLHIIKSNEHLHFYMKIKILTTSFLFALSPSHVWYASAHTNDEFWLYYITKKDMGISWAKQWENNRNITTICLTHVARRAADLLSCWASTSCSRASKSLWLQADRVSPEALTQSFLYSRYYRMQRPLTRCLQWPLL